MSTSLLVVVIAFALVAWIVHISTLPRNVKTGFFVVLIVLAFLVALRAVGWLGEAIP